MIKKVLYKKLQESENVFMIENKGKRDVLIFPKFENINKIQEIRNKYDKLANVILPHITLAFPFMDDMPDDELIEKLHEILKSYKPFNVTFKGVSLSDDNYIFLNCVAGNREIIQLHDEIYEKIIPSHLKKNIKYIPHITLGELTDIIELKNFNDEFKTVINEISLELIGENEESIIIKKFKLNNK